MKKNRLRYLYAFLLPILFFIVDLVIVKLMYPDQNVFSANQILVADLISQYEALFSYLKDVLAGGASLFYSFSKNLGGNMMSTFTYYLSSPLNLILVLFSNNHVIDAMYLLIILKIGLCGLTMYIYLNQHFKKKSYLLLIFSTFYALMGYNMVYYFNIMWLDVVFLTPLVMLGIDRIINGKKIGIYTFFLALAIISNFYIAYMLCIFCVIYFVYRLLLKYSFKTDRKLIVRKILIFIGGSLLAGLLSSAVLLPGLLDLKQMLRIDPRYSEFILTDNYDGLMNFLSRLLVGSQSVDNLLSKMTPNVYFGLFPLVLVILYFFNKKISKKEKVLTGIVYLIFIISFCTNFMNLFWHGFSYPNGYAYRFSFLFSFFSLYIACRSLYYLKNQLLSKSLVIGILCGFLLMSFLLILNGYTEISNILNLSISFFLIGMYLVIIILKGSIKYKKFLSIGLVFFMVIELLLHVNTTLYLTTHLGYETSYSDFRNDVCVSTSYLQENNERVDSMFMLGTLGSFICGHSGISGALTTHNGNVYKFLYDNGFTVTYSTILNELKNTPVIPTLLGLKYYYGNSTILMIPNSYYLLKDYFDYNNYDGEIGNYYIYQNDLALSIGYLIKNNETEFTKKNSFEYQNEIFKNMTGINEKVLKPYKKTNTGKNSYSFDIDNNKQIYVSLKYPIPENAREFAYINIDDVIYEMNSNTNGVFPIENIYNGKKLKVKLSLEEVYNSFDINDDFLSLYYLDDKVFEAGIKVLSKNQLDVEVMEANKFSGNITVEHDKSLLFLSIPYEKGWTVYVDDKKVEYEKLYDTFIGISLNKGEHQIKMEYYPPGLDMGLLLSKIGLVILIVCYIPKKGRVKNENR